MRIAIVTGASSGLGWEYVRALDGQGAYDEIWAVARRADRLSQLADACKTPIRTLSLDLAQGESVARIAQELEAARAQDAGFTVGFLINAAGFGKFATYKDISQQESQAMIGLNCAALVNLTQAVLPYMARGSRIIQIASSAAFQPLPGLAVYAASKSFVLSYTRALRFELRGCGIHVTAVCPIWIKTEFIQVARDSANGRTVKHPWPIIGARRVVRWSLAVNKANYPVATCCISGLAMRVAGKVLPAPLAMWIWEGLRRI